MYRSSSPLLLLFQKTMSAYFVLLIVVLANLLHNGAKGQVDSSSLCSEDLEAISVFPGDVMYHNSTLINNPAYDHVLPAFVALPKTIQDVERCLSCAFEKSVPFTMKSGGHSALGLSTIDGNKNGAFVIYLSEMKHVQVTDEQSVKVQAGARWEDVYNVVKNTDYLVVGGVCPSVGVTGYTLGGGLSFLSREYGLTVDNVLSFTMVTANGSSVVVANSTTNSDLFWALRGGGGGNFGIVVDFTFKLQPSFPTYVYGEIVYSGEASKNVLQVLTMIGGTVYPPELLFDMILGPGNELHIACIHLGLISESTEEKLSELENLASGHERVILSTYWDLRDLHLKKNTYPEVEPHPIIIKASLVKTISPNVAKLLSEIDIPDKCFHSIVHLGAKVKEYSSIDTAFSHRNTEFEIYTTCSYQNETERKTGLTFLTSFYDKLYQSGQYVGNYINDPYMGLHDWQHEFYGNNYERLLDIQKKWNPLDKGMFHYPLSIGSTYNPTSSDSRESHTEL